MTPGQADGRRARIVAAVGLFSVGVLFVLLFHGASGQAAGDGGGPPPIAEQFSVLGEPSQAQLDSLSPAARAMLSGPGVDGGRVEALGEADYAGLPALVVVVGGAVCALDEAPAGGGGLCGTPDEAVSGQLVTAGFCLPGLPAGRARVFGLMPDGVESVAFEGGSGFRRTVSVSDNVYVADLPAVSITIRGENQDGQLGTELPLEEGARASGTCAQH